MSSTKLRAQQALILQKNEPAPYEGILAPSFYVKDLEDKATKYNLYKSSMNADTECLPDLKEIKVSPGFWEGSAFGAVCVGLLVLIIKH